MVSREKRATYDVGDWWNVADAAIEEIERLRSEGQKDYDGMREFQAKYINASHEIENLRTQRDAYATEITGALLPANERLRAEIERLRGLLREWLDSPCQPIAVDILRRTQEALGHE
jgi:hypothetical protein